MTESRIELSVIIPCLNEERRLPRTLKCIREYLESRAISAEIIVVDDGSSDGTVKIGEAARAAWPALKVVRNPGNLGKGYSVRSGMMESRGRVVLFTDADLSAPIEEADKLLVALKTHDVAIGSRAVDRGLIEVHESPVREFLGILFNKAARLILWLPFADTQCGFKAFVRERSRILFEQQRIESFGFDPELLFLARRHGLTVAEVPVRWAHDVGTRVSTFRDGMKMNLDLLRIRWNSWTGRYPRRR